MLFVSRLAVCLVRHTERVRNPAQEESPKVKRHCNAATPEAAHPPALANSSSTEVSLVAVKIEPGVSRASETFKQPPTAVFKLKAIKKEPNVDDDEEDNNLTQPSTAGFSVRDYNSQYIEQNTPSSITPDIEDNSDSNCTLPPASQFCEVSLKESPGIDNTKSRVMPVADNILTDLNVKQLHKLAPQLLNSKFYVKCTKIGLRLVVLQDDYVVLSVEIAATQDGCRTLLKVLGKLLPQHHPINELLGSPSNTKEVTRFVEKLEDWNLCPGNPDVGFGVPANAWRCSRTSAIYSDQCLGLVVQEKCYNCQQWAISMMNS